MKRLFGRRQAAPEPVVFPESYEWPPEDSSFITGNGIAERCRYVINYRGFRVNDDGEHDWCLCKTDFLEEFFAEHEPRDPYVLFTGNSDYPIDVLQKRRLRKRRLKAWFAQNVELESPKLHPIPIGVADPHWPHGDMAALKRIQRDPEQKSRLLDTSFSLASNPEARGYCLNQTGLETMPPLPFEDYLRRLSGSYFCVSPRGNGLDTHRTWEALYVGTVPIVTRSVLTDRHHDLPMIVLDDWAQFRSIEFTPEFYERTWNGWDPAELSLDAYVARVRRLLEREAQAAGRGRGWYPRRSRA